MGGTIMDPASIALMGASMVGAAATTATNANNQNAQIGYQQDVLRQNAIAAQNQAAAEMKTRRNESLRQQATTQAQMASTGIDSTSGSFLDLISQGAAAGEMDVLKAKHDGDTQAWNLNAKVNELESNKKNAWLEAGLAGASAGISSAIDMGFGGPKGISAKSKEKSGKTMPAMATSSETGNAIA